MHEAEWRGLDRYTEHVPRPRDVEERSDFFVEALEYKRAAASREAAEHIEDVRRRLAHEASVPAVSDAPAQKQEPEELNVFQKAYRSLKQSRLAKMLMVAVGLHAPFTPQGRALIDRIVHGVEAVNPNWFKERMVIHPQSEERKAAVRA